MDYWPDMLGHAPIERGPERYAQVLRLLHAAEKMKRFGVRVDAARLAQHVRAAEARAALFTQLFRRLTGLSELSLGASGAGQTDAVREWFRGAGAPDVVFDKRTKKAQFNAAALTAWASDYPGARFAEPAAALLGLRKAKTALAFLHAYGEVSRRHAGRIHFGFNPMGTKGERWSASQRWSWYNAHGRLVKYSLNAQNVPAKNVSFTFAGEGELPIMVSLRDCFIPDRGCVWIKWDGDAAEARIQAYVTGDKTLQGWIEAGLDLHLENAKKVFPRQVPADAVWDKKGPYAAYRAAAKPLQYALPYQYAKHNGTDKYPETFKALKQSFPDFTEARFYRDVVPAFFAAHPSIRAWHARTAREVQETGGYTLPQTGRRLWLPPTFRGFNQALNFQMQSGYGAIINYAVPRIADLMDWEPGGLAMLLQVHDEVDCQVPEARAADIELAVADILGAPMDFGGTWAGVPAKGAVGSNWGNGKDLR